MQGWAGRIVARLGWRVAPVDLAVAAVVFLVCLYLPRAGRAVERHADLNPVELAARGWESVTLIALACVLLVWRRRWPVIVWLAVLTLTVTDTLLTQLPSRCVVAVMVAVYTVAVQTNRRTSVIVAAITAVTIIFPTLYVLEGSIASDATYALAAFSALAAAVGDSVRNQRLSVASAVARAEAAEASREEEARRRVVEERLRIARELHDALAHHVSVVNVQAGVAAHLIARDPLAAQEALVHIRAASQQAIEEMRVMVGLLRTDGNPHLVEAPTPGLTEIPELVDRIRSTGLEVEIVDRVGGRRVPTAVGLTAYRVIQEALTNAGKYGTGTARVVLGENGQMLHIDVSNSVAAPGVTPGHSEHPSGSSGHGLIGMRERVSATGGTLTITENDQFHIRAEIPLNGVGS